MRVWSKVRVEVGEVMWLISIVGGLSVVGVGLAVALVAARVV
jgi:hypothetical protein